MTAFHYYHSIEVRYGDLDPQGHVNNAVYLTYLEQARVGYIRHTGLWIGGTFLDLGVILADIHITYRAPILFGMDIRVGVRVSRLGGKSFTMVYQMEDATTGQVMATAESVMVTYDYHTGQTIPIPEAWRAVMTEFDHVAELESRP